MYFLDISHLDKHSEHFLKVYENYKVKYLNDVICPVCGQVQSLDAKELVKVLICKSKELKNTKSILTDKSIKKRIVDKPDSKLEYGRGGK